VRPSMFPEKATQYVPLAKLAVVLVSLGNEKVDVDLAIGEKPICCVGTDVVDEACEMLELVEYEYELEAS